MKDILDAILKEERGASDRAIEAQNEAMAIVSAARQSVSDMMRAKDAAWNEEKKKAMAAVEAEASAYEKELRDKYTRELKKNTDLLESKRESITKSVFSLLTGTTGK